MIVLGARPSVDEGLALVRLATRKAVRAVDLNGAGWRCPGRRAGGAAESRDGNVEAIRALVVAKRSAGRRRSRP